MTESVAVPPRVTVIIATYNWSTVLPYSIGSVLRQTYSDFEVLVVGDACTDDSGEVVAKIGDERVRWINLPVNSKHQSGPNNEGLRQARGEFIAYLGHDDLWFPHHLASALTVLDESGADVSSSIAASVGPDGERITALVPLPEYQRPGPPSCTVYRRRVTEKIGGWRHYRDIAIQPEVDLWRRAAAAGFRFQFVPRLTAIKFSAGLRRNVYRERPFHEQATWLHRIDTEKDLEVIQLARMIAGVRDPGWFSYRDLVRAFASQTMTRFRLRLTDTGIDATRRFKGL